MASLEKYFKERDSHLPAPKWVYGDRVSGKIGKIPVLGMVIREDYTDRSMVLCHLDLPVKIENEYRWVTLVPSRGMKRLEVLHD
jgi:hypothetical protein